MKTDPTILNYVSETSYLINEVLYALSLSGVSECGDVTNLLAPVVEEANRIAPSMSNRPDFDYLAETANNRSQKIKDMCDTDQMFGGDYLFMSQEPLGNVILEMANFMKQ